MSDDDRPDSGIFEVEAAIAETANRRDSDRVMRAFLRGPWTRHREEFRAHMRQEEAQQAQVDRLVDAWFGPADPEGHRERGFVLLVPDLERMVVAHKCVLKGVRFVGVVLTGDVLFRTGTAFGWW